VRAHLQHGHRAAQCPALVLEAIKRKPLSKRLGSALVMTLVIIVLITVVTVGYLASVMLKQKQPVRPWTEESLRRRHDRRP
jgi:hypothetical protein